MGVAIVLFSDLVDSTALLARLGDDRMDRLRRCHVEDVTDAVESNGGRVIKTLGDGVMSSFESALGGLHAAAAIQGAVERLDAEQGEIGIAARVGVAAGEPIADGEDLHGMAVVIASRLSSAARTGDVLVQDLVQALVASRDGVALEEARDYQLKGVPAPVRASRLLWRDLAPRIRDDGQGAAAGDAASGRIRLPPPLAAYADEPLIGRDREIAMLREQTAARPGRRAVLILGEPGIGKTRHAAAAAGEAHAGGATVVFARCPPETIVPFEPWVRAIGELALSGDDVWRQTLAAAAGPELSALVPGLGRQAQPDERAGASEFVAAEGARYRLLSGIGAALACAAKGVPLYVVLDDAHWCDRASVQALAHLLESPPAHELVLIATAREEEMGRGHPVSRALSDLRRTGNLSELRLEGLDARGMAALVGARLGRAITPALATRLLDRTAGNPFFAGELARDLDEKGALRDDSALDTAPVPDAVTGLVEERLAQLDPATERLLTAAAAIGPSAPVALAAQAAGLEIHEAERAAQAALSERLVEDVSAAQPTIAFAHALVREALVAQTGGAARARLHLEIARALEKDAAAEPAELARHYGLSVELAGPEPAIEAHRAAAASAAEGHDHEQAASHLRGLLGLLPEKESRARAQTLLELGEQELLTADLVSARRSFLGAVEAARTTGDSATLARAALGFAGGDIGFGWESGTDDPAAVALLREGMEALGDEDPRLALQMTFRLAYLMVFSEDGDALAALARRAEDLKQRLGDAEAQVLAGLTEQVAKVGRIPGRLSEPPRIFEDMERSLGLLAAAEESGREDLLFRVLQWLAAVHYAMGRIPECEQALERAAEIAERLGSPRFSWEVDLNRGLRRFDRGDREGAEALMRRAGAVVRRVRPDLHIFLELTWLVVANWVYGGDNAMLRLVYETMNEEIPRGAVSATIASAAAAEGDGPEARSRLRALLADDLERLRRPDTHLPAALCILAYAAYTNDDREAGARLRPLLEPLRDHIVAVVPAIGSGLSPEWAIGVVELLAERPDVAARELSDAVARSDRHEIAWASAWYRCDLAVALSSQRRCPEGPGDAGRGRIACRAIQGRLGRQARRRGTRRAGGSAAPDRASREWTLEAAPCPRRARRPPRPSRNGERPRR
ncbi:MAG TPA: AAA family ATPase [Solirubrobacterales bacterium]|nr:AAA family ATPase [Solirubrobacterales bacterium]